MRIIGGRLGGRILRLPKDLKLRPTTDFAAEGLFNMLSNKVDFENISVLDLFSGTGHISIEFASRGCSSVTAIDQNFKCVGFLRSVSKELNLNVHTCKGDVFAYLRSCTQSFHVIFADPPYDMPNITDIHRLVMENKLLKAGGMLVIEHGPRTHLEELAGFEQKRKYGNVNFSFFSFENSQVK